MFVESFGAGTLSNKEVLIDCRKLFPTARLYSERGSVTRSAPQVTGSWKNRIHVSLPPCCGSQSRAPSEKFPGGCDVALDLFAQRIKGGKLLFVAQFSGEHDLQFLTVDVT